MHKIRQIVGILVSSLYAFVFSKKFVLFSAVAILFSAYTFSGLNGIAEFYGIKVSAYVFPFYVANPSMLLIFGVLVIYLFSDVPFTEPNTYFAIMRVNRRIYYVAKIIYILTVSVLAVAVLAVSSIIVVLWHADFSNQWGKIIYTLSSNSQTILDQTGASIGFGVNQIVVNKMSPWVAMAYAVVLMVLVFFFMGILMMSVSILISKNMGYVVGGFFVSLSYFSVFLGAISYGGVLYFLSPFSWCSLNWLDLYHGGLAPSPMQAVLTIVGVTTGLEIVAFLKFQNCDLGIE